MSELTHLDLLSKSVEVLSQLRRIFLLKRQWALAISETGHLEIVQVFLPPLQVVNKIYCFGVETAGYW